MCPKYDFKEAVRQLGARGINATDRAYGFSIAEQDADGKIAAECGIENDGSVAMSVRSETAPVAWFFRPSAAGVVSLLLAAKRLLSEGKQLSWIDALKASEANESR